MNRLLTIRSTNLEVSVSPEVGASIYSMRYRLKGDGEKWVDIMRTTPPKALENGDAGAFASFHMIPFSNRIANAELKFKDQIYHLIPNTEDGHAIHGDVRNRPWEILGAEEREMELAFDSSNFSDMNWPFPFSARIKFTVMENTFIITMELTNEGTEVCPAGMGTHPYYSRHLTPADDKVLIQLPLKGIYPGEGTIPTGTWTEIPEELDFSTEKELGTDLHIDNVYRVKPGSAVIKWPGSGVKFTMIADPIFEHLVFYCPMSNPEYFAIEPAINCNNGFNMAENGIPDTGTIFLEPGETIKGNILIRIEG